MRLVVAFAHVAGGGVPQVTPTHGLGAHAVPRQPHVHVLVTPAMQTPKPAHVPAAVATPLVQLAAAQGVSIVAKSHVAVLPTALQVPVEAEVRRVVPSAQVGGGGTLHVSVAHGSPAQAVPEHPNVHVLVAPAAQTPAPEHVPAAVAMPLVQLAGGQGTSIIAYSHVAVPPTALQVPVEA